MTSADPVAETIAYYDRRAEEFTAQTADLDLSSLYDRFLRRVRPGGRVLDAGCGPGRDALAFKQLGYQVVAFDASESLVRKAQQRLGSGIPVHHMRFTNVNWHAEFDGVWACASLLHVPLSEFHEVGRKLAQSLQQGGVWYLSFKLGRGERLEGGRLFTDHDETSLQGVLHGLPVEILETWRTDDFRPGRQAEKWLNAIVRRL